MIAAGPFTFEEVEAVLSSRPAAPEGGPDLYDPRTRTVLAHPAQKLAIEAFARELATDVAGSTPAGGSTGAGVEAGDGERGVGPVKQVRREDRPTYLPPGVEVCSCEEALALRTQLAELRRVFDTDAVTCREALDRVDELERERDALRAEVEHPRDGGSES